MILGPTINLNVRLSEEKPPNSPRAPPPRLCNPLQWFVSQNLVFLPGRSRCGLGASLICLYLSLEASCWDRGTGFLYEGIPPWLG